MKRSKKFLRSRSRASIRLISKLVTFRTKKFRNTNLEKCYCPKCGTQDIRATSVTKINSGMKCGTCGNTEPFLSEREYKINQICN